MGRCVRERDWSELSLVALLIGRFQHWPLSTGLRVSFAARPLPSSCWAQCLHWGNGQPCSTSLPVQTLADPRAGISAKPHMGCGKGWVCPRTWGRLSQGGGTERGQGTKGCHGDHARETVPHTEDTLSHAVPAQWGCGTTCGAAGLGRRRTGHCQGVTTWNWWLQEKSRAKRRASIAVLETKAEQGKCRAAAERGR